MKMPWEGHGYMLAQKGVDALLAFLLTHDVCSLLVSCLPNVTWCHGTLNSRCNRGRRRWGRPWRTTWMGWPWEFGSYYVVVGSSEVLNWMKCKSWSPIKFKRTVVRTNASFKNILHSKGFRDGWFYLFMAQHPGIPLCPPIPQMTFLYVGLLVWQTCS